mgnify:CR=1 FL=1
MENLLEVRGLKTHFATDRGLFRAVDGISFSVPRGRTAVSYTHLTLPTIYSVYVSVVAVSLKKKHPNNTTHTTSSYHIS